MPPYHIIELTSTCWWKDMKPICSVHNLVQRTEPRQNYIRNGGVKKGKERKNELDDQINKAAEKKKEKKEIVRKTEPKQTFQF